MAQAIAEFEPVSMIASPDSAEEAVQCVATRSKSLPCLSTIAGMRDTGPAFLVNEKRRCARNLLGLQRLGREVPVQGGCALLARRLLGELKLLAFAGPLVIEGGNLCA